MPITEVRIQSLHAGEVAAFLSVTLAGDFGSVVIHDLKLVRVNDGLLLSMPSRRVAVRCPRCGGKNQCVAAFCQHCGTHMPRYHGPQHQDIAHPIDQDTRNVLEEAVLAEYRRYEGFVKP